MRSRRCATQQSTADELAAGLQSLPLAHRAHVWGRGAVEIATDKEHFSYYLAPTLCLTWPSLSLCPLLAVQSDHSELVAARTTDIVVP